jgi:hypothetical protein
MLRPLLIAAALSLCASGACSQPSVKVVRPQQNPEIACRSDRHDNKPHKKKLWDGYEISLGPVAGEVEYACTAAIYRADGKVVYRTSGFNVTFDEENTGLDFDGDGKAEVVFKTDTGGGNHCCWQYNIISLYPKPRHLFDIDQQGLVRFEKEKNGRLIIWKRTEAPYSTYTSMAARPFAEKVLQVRRGKLTDITPEYCAPLFTDQNPDFREWKDALTLDKLERLRKTGEANRDNEEVISALFSKVAQHIFCRQFDEAFEELDRWPEPSRAKLKQDFAKAVKGEYPEFAARLSAAPN